MISKNRIEALIIQAENEEVEGDIEPVLERALTVGDLIKALQEFNPETPVELEIPVDFDGNNDMITEVGFVIDVFQSPGENTDADVITLRACKPDMLEPYDQWAADETDL